MKRMGHQYIETKTFNIDTLYAETTCSTPVFFVLFPGVDPTISVEKIGAKYGKSVIERTFVNIPMGQGQEKGAENALDLAAKEGHWIMLQNIHLMQTWCLTLEIKLEKCILTAHPEFRCFLSSEPPPMPTWKIIPEPILQNAIKVANEAPSDLKANLKRA